MGSKAAPGRGPAPNPTTAGAVACDCRLTSRGHPSPLSNVETTMRESAEIILVVLVTLMNFVMSVLVGGFTIPRPASCCFSTAPSAP
jgi:hypothetical protein